MFCFVIVFGFKFVCIPNNNKCQNQVLSCVSLTSKNSNICKICKNKSKYRDSKWNHSWNTCLLFRDLLERFLGINTQTIRSLHRHYSFISIRSLWTHLMAVQTSTVRSNGFVFLIFYSNQQLRVQIKENMNPDLLKYSRVASCLAINKVCFYTDILISRRITIIITGTKTLPWVFFTRVVLTGAGFMSWNLSPHINSMRQVGSVAAQWTVTVMYNWWEKAGGDNKEWEALWGCGPSECGCFRDCIDILDHGDPLTSCLDWLGYDSTPCSKKAQ